jgi:tripartite-type tricarboxylate transporter receptor subunit TctC
LIRALLLAAALLPALVAAQVYPAKAVRIIVPLAAGGTGDTLARLLAEELGRQLQGSFIVENRPGAGGVIGTEMVARSVPDGYTLLSTSSSHVVNTALRPKLWYDPLKDFTPIAQIADTHQVLLAHPSVPANNIKELIALAKAKPGGLTYASAGNGSATHLNAELFRSIAGISLLHVPYKGSTQSRTDLLSGQVHLSVDGLLPTLPLVRAGKLKALAVTNNKRATVAPEIPTMAEAGVPGYESNTWYALIAPGGIPEAVTQRLLAAVTAAMSNPALREKFAQQGAEPVLVTGKEFVEMMRTDLARWKKVVADTGVQVD